MKAFSHLWKYLTELFLEWEILQIEVVEKIKTHVLCSVTFFRKSFLLWDNVEKCGGAREAADDIMAASRMLAARAQPHTLAHASTHTHTRTHSFTHVHTRTEKSNIYIYIVFTATIIWWTRLSVTLYVHCLSFSFICSVLLLCIFLSLY